MRGRKGKLDSKYDPDDKIVTAEFAQLYMVDSSEKLRKTRRQLHLRRVSPRMKCVFMSLKSRTDCPVELGGQGARNGKVDKGRLTHRKETEDA